MGAPGTMVEGAEKPVMRAVVVWVRREVREMRRVRGRIFGGFCKWVVWMWVGWRLIWAGGGCPGWSGMVKAMAKQ